MSISRSENATVLFVGVQSKGFGRSDTTQKVKNSAAPFSVNMCLSNFQDLGCTTASHPDLYWSGWDRSNRLWSEAKMINTTMRDATVLKKRPLNWIWTNYVGQIFSNKPKEGGGNCTNGKTPRQGYHRENHGHVNISKQIHH